MNQYPGWKYALIVVVLALGVFYSLPNLFGKRPSIVLSSRAELDLDKVFVAEVLEALEKQQMKPAAHEISPDAKKIYFHYPNSDDGKDLRAKAYVYLEGKYSEKFNLAMTLTSDTPAWLRVFGAEPMALGLDLQGGVHALMEVNMDEALKRALDRYRKELRQVLRKSSFDYQSVVAERQGLTMSFETQGHANKVLSLLSSKYPQFEAQLRAPERLVIEVKLTPAEITKERDAALEKNILTLRRRLNEAGVSEPVVQRHGESRIVVQMPGVENPDDVLATLNKQATLEARGVHEDSDSFERGALTVVPIGAEEYKTKEGRRILLKDQIIWDGENIQGATAGPATSPSSQGLPAVHITLDAKGGDENFKYSTKHVNKRMAILYIDNVQFVRVVDGKRVIVNEIQKTVISDATINSSLFRNFETTGFSEKASQQLAVQIRSGALAAPMIAVEVRTVGPTLGADNIRQGLLSVMIGFALVAGFMLIYYRVFGIFANIALFFNLVLLTALLSTLPTTLTLPGIAGIVLTLGMAVDSNVLINERIREELRLGNSIQASIYAGYEKAFATIADSNLTTLIAGVVLMGVGSGPVRGFAVSLSLGIITSMFTAILVTRAIVNLTYGGRPVKKLSI